MHLDEVLVVGVLTLNGCCRCGPRGSEEIIRSAILSNSNRLLFVAVAKADKVYRFDSAGSERHMGRLSISV